MKYSDGQPCLDKIDERFQVSDIDQKLIPVLNVFGHHVMVDVVVTGSIRQRDIDHAIAQIKQCFEEDEGWVDLSALKIEGPIMPVDSRELTRLMTGKEWYERFMSEINIPRDLGYAQTPDEAKKLLEGWIDEAARRAAGLGESDE